MASGPIIDGPALADHLGGSPDPELCAVLAEAVSEALAALVDTPAETDPWPAGTRSAGLMAGADLYKAATGTGGGYQLDASTYTVDYRMTATFLRRYESLLGTNRAVGGMAG